jgi:hypothetical protein
MSRFAATTTKALIRTTTGLWLFTDVQFIEIYEISEWWFPDPYRTPDALRDLS